MAHRHVHAHRHAEAHQHNDERRDIWDTVTSAVGGVFEERSPLTIVKTVYTTQTPSGYTGALKTLGGDDATETETPTTTAAAATQTTQATATPKHTTSSSSSSTKKTETATVKADEETTSASSETAKTTATAKQKTAAVNAASDTSSSIDATTAAATDSVLTVDTRTTMATSTSAQTTAMVGTPTSVTASSSTASSSADSSSSSSSDSGSSAGTKAGIAIGVLGGLFVVGLLVFLLFRKRQKQAQRQRLADDEKMHGPYGSRAAAGAGTTAVPPVAAAHSGSYFDTGAPTTSRTSPLAPRLSLRPVTQFLPNWISGGAVAAGAAGAGAGGGAAMAASHYQNKDHLSPASYPDRRTSRGPAIALQDTSPRSARAPGASTWERPSTSSGNPFGDTAKRVDPFAHPNDSTANLAHSPHSSTASSDEFGSVLSSPSPLNISPIAATASSTAAVGAAGAFSSQSSSSADAPSSLTRKASTRKDGPKALDLTLTPPTIGTSLSPVPPSPSGTEFSVNSVASGQNVAPSASAAAIAAAGGPAISTVHRVQLDFKPTLEDELELRAGQLVRLLHEYDDGWALCIRLDRSQQGVVPRTCLSTRPVKPRPAPGGGRRGPPVNPSGQQGRPITPQGGRGPRPGPGPNGQRGPMQPRPQSPYGARPGSRSQSPAPGGGRPQSPGPRYQGRPPSRPQSPGGMSARRVTPPGPSQMSQQQQQRQPQQHRRPSGGQSIGRKPVPGQAY